MILHNQTCTIQFQPSTRESLDRIRWEAVDVHGSAILIISDMYNTADAMHQQ